MGRSSPEREAFELKGISMSNAQIYKPLGKFKVFWHYQRKGHTGKERQETRLEKRWKHWCLTGRLGLILKAVGSTRDICKHYIQLLDFWKRHLPWSPLSDLAACLTVLGLIIRLALTRNATFSFYWGLSLSPLWAYWNHKLHDRETLNLGQIHLGGWFIKKANPLPRWGRRRLPMLIYICQQNRNVLASHIWTSHCFLATLLPPRHHAGQLGSGTSLFRPQHHKNSTNQVERLWDPQKLAWVSLSPSPGFNTVISSPHGTSSRSQTGYSIETLGAAGTEEIIYHLQFTGLQGERDLENFKHPMVQGTPCPNIILHQAFTALLNSPLDPSSGALTHLVGGSPCHPHQPIQSSQVTSDPAKEHTSLTGNSPETCKYLGARTSSCFVT